MRFAYWRPTDCWLRALLINGGGERGRQSLRRFAKEVMPAFATARVKNSIKTNSYQHSPSVRLPSIALCEINGSLLPSLLPKLP
jgi:hypothetical protein